MKALFVLALAGMLIFAGCPGLQPDGGPARPSREKSQEIARYVSLESSTYAYDGAGLALQETATLKCPYCWSFAFSYFSSHAGYGNRSGQALAQAITPHTILVTVNSGKVIGAVVDGKYDEIALKLLENNGTGMANPASVHCSEKGYSLEIRKGAGGGEAGYCLFPNGRECEEWAFFRGECTDADSFEMVESPGYTANPKQISYKFYSDGRLVLATTDLRTGNVTSLFAWLKASDFAAFVKLMDGMGFGALNASYNSCGRAGANPNEYFGGCPTDMPSFSLKLMRQGNEKTVGVYWPADRPEAIDEIVAAYKKLFEANSFVDISDSGCSLMQNKVTKQLACFGCVSGITNPSCTTPTADFQAVENEDGILGSCTVDANGACAYVPPEKMTQKLCESGRGSWNECGSACRGAPEGTACILMCIQQCECGGIAGVGCPAGYFCGDDLPKGAADAMGICKRVQ